MLVVALIATVGGVIAASAPVAATLPGVNGLVAFSDGSTIFAVVPDGTGVRKVTAGFDPAWSPSGQRLAFVREDPEGRRLYQSAADGADDDLVFDAAGVVGVRNPAWSPDGTRIAFSAGTLIDCCNTRSDIYTVTADGRNLINLTPGENDIEGYEPSWAPDGSKIVFRTRDFPRNGLAVIDVATGEIQVIWTPPDTPDGSPRSAFDPDWSPDGSRIALGFGVGTGSLDVWVMDADGTDAAALTAGGETAKPVWSPDGSSIAFQKHRWEFADEIWVMDDDGGDPRRVTQLSGAAMYAGSPAWQPVDPAASTGFIDGVVSSASGMQLEGMCVLAWDAAGRTGPVPEPSLAVTDQAGVFRLEVPSGRGYILHVWDCDQGLWEWEWYDDRNDAGAADVVAVPVGPAPYVEVTLHMGGGINGTVTDDATGALIADVEVWIRDAFGYYTHWYGLTNENGEYAVTGLRPGAVHHIEFYDPDEQYRWEYFDDEPRFEIADDVFVTSDHWTPDIDAFLGPWYDGVFKDDDGSIFQDDIEWLAETGITRGCNPPDNTEFCPADRVTRGQMAAFLVRALGYSDSKGNLFTDDDGSIFENDINKLGTAGVTRGCNPPLNTMFCPADAVSRAQMAAFLVRALGYTDPGGNLFVDDDDSIFENDINCLGTAGVTKGCNPPINTMFCPAGLVTRGQMAAFLHRALAGIFSAAPQELSRAPTSSGARLTTRNGDLYEVAH